MGQRIDFYDDPEAPAVNSVRPAAAALVIRNQAILLIQRSDNDNWCMPGGAHEPGESLTATAVRETFEETGITIRPSSIVGIFTDPRHVTLYTSDGEVRQEFSVVFRADYLDGEPTCSSESNRVAWVPLKQITHLTMDRSQRHRISWGLAHPERTWIDPTGD
jgi:8-oxo-dGTP pyrophosphatase MutT (NUDIX family)